jgi:ferrous iron transport protein B
MSCSARLPVYILLIGAVFPAFKGTLLFTVYLLGILVAVFVALVFRKTMFKSSDAPFVMELPPYRLPTFRSVTKHMWMKASQYLRKMGGIILIASVLIWALGYYPTGDKSVSAHSPENSYIARIGKSIEPVIAPLGFDWRMGVCLLTGIAAKEIVVSTMGVIYPDEPQHPSAPLENRISASPAFTPAATLSFLVFTLLYFPCLATLTAIYNETGSVKWSLFSIIMTTTLAWLFSFITYHAVLLFI